MCNKIHIAYTLKTKILIYIDSSCHVSVSIEDFHIVDAKIRKQITLLPLIVCCAYKRIIIVKYPRGNA